MTPPSEAQPTELPEGDELPQFPSDEGNDPDDADRAALHRALLESQAEADRGELLDWADVVAEMTSSAPPQTQESSGAFKRHGG